MDLVAVIEDAVVTILRDAVIHRPSGRGGRPAEGGGGGDQRHRQDAAGDDLEEPGGGRAALPAPVPGHRGPRLLRHRKGQSTSFNEGIRRGVVRATREIPLRPNAVHPLTRENPGTNVGDGLPRIVYRPTGEDHTDITVLPKGAGSENMSALAMLTPSEGLKGVKRFVLDTVVRAGGRPCPPTIVGVGIGGTADLAMRAGQGGAAPPADRGPPTIPPSGRWRTSFMRH